MMRVGELTESPHVLKAKDVYLGDNKDKILIVLYSSKTHDISQPLQQIKISANSNKKNNKHFCPFKIIDRYNKLHGDYCNLDDRYFVFSDGTPVHPEHARKVLRQVLDNLGLESELYDMHSLRIGRTTDLINLNYPVEVVKRLGCWTSNVVYKYIR